MTLLEDHYVATDLGRIRLRVGEQPTASPMLFWPSLLMDGRMWLDQARHFSDGHQVVLVDPPGHGASSALTGSFTFDACARTLVQILDELSIERVHHVGNSWGAMIGVTVAARSPERIASAVLMNGTASPAGRRQSLEYGALVAAARLIGFRGPLVSAAVDAFVGPTSRRLRPQVEAAIRTSIAGLNARSAAHAVRSVVPRRPDQRPLLSDVHSPVLVVAGAEDATFPVAETKVMADGISGAEFVVLDDAAHLAALEVPQRTNELIEDFLQRRT